MEIYQLFSVILVIISLHWIQPICGFENGDGLKTSTRRDVLDHNGNYVLTWNTDFKSQIITFCVTVKTLGFIGFGISKNGDMSGADIVIGGVYPNGTSYFADYHAKGNQRPELDPIQNWDLLSASENGTHTKLTFKRIFNTCDKNDISIGNDTINVIWSFGNEDGLRYHLTNRGNLAVNLLDPAMPALEANVQTWRISIDYEMPADETTYWCTIHKNPPLDAKHHLIGFEAYLPTPEARAHIHHFIVHECQRQTPEDDLEKLTEPLVKSNGDHCYKLGNAGKIIGYCRAYLLVWATGGKRTVFPENVGYPIVGSDSYYMLEIHYNNPGKLQGLKFEGGVDIFYTPKLREFEAATLTIGHNVALSQIIPPKVKSFTTVGHCSPECTNSSIPAEGLTVFNVLLHSHLAGRKIKLRQFRDGKELPWPAYDNNYKFDFQQNRPIRDNIKILPGDQLAVECEYETMDRENVTIGGFGSNEEMCQTFMLYYPKIDTWFCGSVYPPPLAYKSYGIEKYEWLQGTTDLKVTAPPQHAGKQVSDVLNEIDWTEAKTADLQSRTRFSDHNARCLKLGQGLNYSDSGSITYPHITEEYALPDSCAK